MSTIIIEVQFGLGNRLRAMASAMLVSKITGRHLKVVWRKDLHCGANFSDLFKSGLDVITHLPESDLTDCDVYNYMDNAKRRSKELILDLTSNRDIYIVSAFGLDYSGKSIEKENELLRRLELADNVERIVNNYSVSDAVGVHIRMGGGKNHSKDRWDSDEFWDREAKEKMYFWREKSHYKAFINEIDKMIKDDPLIRFFLATDMKSTYEIFLDRYSGRISYVDRDCFDRSKDQQIFALADLVLLSKTKRIIGSYWSSFTEIAQRLGGNKVKLAGIDF